jgi:hypothetical protein
MIDVPDRPDLDPDWPYSSERPERVPDIDRELYELFDDPDESDEPVIVTADTIIPAHELIEKMFVGFNQIFGAKQ